MFSEGSASNKNALKTKGCKRLRPRQLFCPKSELNTNERGEFPSPPPKVVATLCKAGGKVEGRLFYICDLKCSWSQTQRVREPQAKYQEHWKCFLRRRVKSHLWVHKRQSKRSVGQKGKIRKEPSLINCVV